LRIIEHEGMILATVCIVNVHLKLVTRPIAMAMAMSNAW